MLYHLKIFLRNLRQGGIYSVINIGGLAIGMAAAGLILLWVFHHLSYDRFHEKDKHLYKIWTRDDVNGFMNTTPALLGQALLDNYPEFANMTRYDQYELPLVSFEKNNASFEERTAIIVGRADPGFLQMFSFPFLHGDAQTALNDISSLILTKTAAIRLFGTEDALGKMLAFGGDIHFVVTGIIQDLPHNTDFQFEILIPIDRFEPDPGWHGKLSTLLYVELHPGVDVKATDAAMRDIIAKQTGGRVQTESYLQPVSQWHLRSAFTGGVIDVVRIFTLIAFFILLIACINFVNLRTAQSARYAKETGVRKLFVAGRLRLIGQFLEESIWLTLLAGMAAILIIYACLPYFNALTGEQIALDFINVRFWMGVLLLIVFTGLLAGSYPAFYLTSFSPVKTTNRGRQGAAALRKILVVTQFTFAVVLIVSTTVVYRQIDFAKTRHLGYNQMRLLSIQLEDNTRNSLEVIWREILASGLVESASPNFATMTESQSTFTDALWRGKNPNDNIIIERNYTAVDWAKTTGVEIIQGRDIDIFTYPGDSTAMLLNEAAVKAMGFDNPVGEIIREFGTDYHVVGVVRDFVFESPYDPIRPMTIGGPKGWFNHLHLKLSAQGDPTEILQQIQAIFKKHNPGAPFVYQFAGEVYRHRFDRERRMGSMIIWFAGLAVFISCLGLFGLSAYMAENRRKEIGIRRVMGASIVHIAGLLSKEFLILVTVSLVIGLPVAWWVMHQWLMGYAYRTHIPWWLLAGVAALTMVIALATVSVQAIKAATANPVESIKTE